MSIGLRVVQRPTEELLQLPEVVHQQRPLVAGRASRLLRVLPQRRICARFMSERQESG